MNCENARERMMDWMDGRLSPDAANELKAHVDRCPACQAELAATRRMAALLDAPPPVRPSPALRAGIYAAIAAEKGEKEEARSSASASTRSGRDFRRNSFSLHGLLQALGACALLAVGYFAGVRHPQANVPAPAAAGDAASKQEIAELRARIDTMGQFVGYTLAQQQNSSTNQRLETVLTTASESKPDSHAIDSLISSLALDPSVNVRLSAVQALYAHADQEVVRTAIAVSLPRETSPLVQLAMIDFLAAAKDHAAAPILEKLSTSAGADPAVKEAAGRAFAEVATHF